MSTLIVLENMDPPTGCKSCPFINEDISCCELLSVAANKTVNVNKYSSIPNTNCPMHELDRFHGRILDEKDIRTIFGEMPFGSVEGKFTMMDVFANISLVNEVAPRFINPGEKVKRAVKNVAESVRRAAKLKEEIEQEIEDAGKDSDV